MSCRVHSRETCVMCLSSEARLDADRHALTDARDELARVRKQLATTEKELNLLRLQVLRGEVVRAECHECAAPFIPAADLASQSCAACGEFPGQRCRDCCHAFTTADIDATGRCPECAERRQAISKRDRELAQRGVI